MEATVQVRQRGILTLPPEWQDKFNIGDAFRLVELDGVYVLTPIQPRVPELAREIEQARIEAGLSTKELLVGLREQRERYYHERYDDASTQASGLALR